MSVTRRTIEGRKAWEKRYRDDGRIRRRVGLRALDSVARRLGMAALRPPPHYAGGSALAVEARRLHTLRAQGVRVPEVLSEADGALCISDMGRTLAAQLREAAGDAAATDALTRAAVSAIVAAHARGAYLGQPLPRNMTFGAGGIGFLDFEEDPLEVMTLEQAQARDWVLFAFGMAKYYDRRPDALADIIAEAIRIAPGEVTRHVRRVGARLRRFGLAIRWLGRSARALAHSILVIHAATTWTLLLGLLLVDWISDGDLDIVNFLF